MISIECLFINLIHTQYVQLQYSKINRFCGGVGVKAICKTGKPHYLFTSLITLEQINFSMKKYITAPLKPTIKINNNNW